MSIEKPAKTGTTTYDNDLVVFIGRFQLPHEGHMAVIKEGLQRAKRVLLLIGSANAPRCHRNPFTYIERAQMLRESVAPELRSRLFTRPLEDSAYNDAQWLRNAQMQTQYASIEIQNEGPTEAVDTVALIGHSKDESSYYLKLFPQWDSIPVKNYLGLSSTDFREKYFSDDRNEWLEDPKLKGIISPTVVEFLKDFSKRPDYQSVLDEYKFNKEYHKQWEDAPYPPTFVTTDACVVQSGNVLLVRRRNLPGKGLWAFPGGFLNAKESIEAGMIRELREETKLAVPTSVLKGSIVAREVFDDPNRSARGRTITHGFLIHLKPEEALPKIRKRRVDIGGPDLPVVEGADDAEKAQWWPISQVRREMMFEDHMDILNNLVARI